MQQDLFCMFFIIFNPFYIIIHFLQLSCSYSCAIEDILSHLLIQAYISVRFYNNSFE